MRQNLKLPDYLETRRAMILAAIKVRTDELIQARIEMIEAVNAYNTAVAGLNKVTDHATGWAVQAYAVIDLDVIGERPLGWLNSEAGKLALEWLTEYDRAEFSRVAFAEHAPPPRLDHAATLADLPHYPNALQLVS